MAVERRDYGEGFEKAPEKLKINEIAYEFTPNRDRYPKVLQATFLQDSLGELIKVTRPLIQFNKIGKQLQIQDLSGNTMFRTTEDDVSWFGARNESRVVNLFRQLLELSSEFTYGKSKEQLDTIITYGPYRKMSHREARETWGDK